MSEQKYIVRVTDHGHFMDEEGERIIEFVSLEAAIDGCQKIIDRSLDELFTPGMSEEQLLKQFLLFGEEASIDGFESMQYIKDRSKHLCA